MERLSQTLSKLSLLSSVVLDFGDSYIDERQIMSINHALKQLPLLLSFDLYILLPSLSEEEMRVMNLELQSLPQVKNLVLKSSQSNEESIKIITNNIQNVYSITGLDLSCEDSITDDVLKNIGRLLQYLPSLSSLKICNYAVTNKGVENLCKGLRHAASLKNLFISFFVPNIDSKAFENLSNEFKYMPLLSKMTLRFPHWNHIDEQDLAQFYQSFVHLPALDSLSLKFSRIPERNAFKAMQHLDGVYKPLTQLKNLQKIELDVSDGWWYSRNYNLYRLN